MSYGTLKPLTCSAIPPPPAVAQSPAATVCVPSSSADSTDGNGLRRTRCKSSAPDGAATMIGSIAYVANGTYGVSLIDVSNPAKQQHFVSYYLMDPVRDTIAINDVLLLAGKSVNGPNKFSVIAGMRALPP